MYIPCYWFVIVIVIATHTPLRDTRRTRASSHFSVLKEAGLEYRGALRRQLQAADVSLMAVSQLGFDCPISLAQ